MRTVRLTLAGKATAEIAARSIPSPYNDVRIGHDAAFWSGSVPTFNRGRVEHFLKMADEGRFEDMAQLGCIESDLLYAVLIQSSYDDHTYTLAVLRQDDRPLPKQPCLFSKVFTGLKVIAVPAQGCELPGRMTKLGLRAAIRALFNRRRDNKRAR